MSVVNHFSLYRLPLHKADRFLSENLVPVVYDNRFGEYTYVLVRNYKHQFFGYLSGGIEDFFPFVNSEYDDERPSITYVTYNSQVRDILEK